MFHLERFNESVSRITQIHNNRGWTLMTLGYVFNYSISRYGEHQQGRILFSELKEKVWTENFNYWLQSLEFFSRGEEILARKENTPLQEKLVSVTCFSFLPLPINDKKVVINLQPHRIYCTLHSTPSREINQSNMLTGRK